VAVAVRAVRRAASTRTVCLEPASGVHRGGGWPRAGTALPAAAATIQRRRQRDDRRGPLPRRGSGRLARILLPANVAVAQEPPW